MMTVLITCPECGSAIHIQPDLLATHTCCDICKHEIKIFFQNSHKENRVEICPVCERKDFYSQKDFNRKLGVILFVIAAILSIWTYGLSFIVLYLADLILFRKLHQIAVCYKCETIFRGASNVLSIPPFNHEMNDRIQYADHNFEGKPLQH
ncbi:MAG: hypothetical protein KBD63_03870 [Bacteriovoracaceae bacterium]|nr:hypothetical protein [Bacteriovoracaceae bacterium]